MQSVSRATRHAKLPSSLSLLAVALARAFVPSARLRGRPVCRDLHHQRAIVADLLDRRQRRGPVDGAVERDQMLVHPPAIVVHVRRDQMPRDRFDRIDEVADQIRMAEVEADPDVGRPRGSSSTKWTSEPARDSSFGMTSSASCTPRARQAAAALRGCGARRRGCCLPAGRF